ncbi:flavin monoamine oxidase family protein [Neorhodopirellula lusitana]|uniref:flavin monoamine oxidase family protein n=1 Tax=Neorhodopirellula lusitana TaxID=445327 RepID=UPI00384FE4A6
MSRMERLRYSRRQLVQMVCGGSALSLIPAGCDSLQRFVSGALPAAGELLSPNREAGHRLRLPREARWAGIVAETQTGAPAAASDAESRNTVSSETASSDAATSEVAGGPSATTRHSCVIVGAGVAGLSAGWHLLDQGIDDFVILELESEVGGTARSGRTGDFQYPWGAHYLPVPKVENEALIRFLQSCSVVDSVHENRVEVAEQFLCRDPEERVFSQGRWWGGLVPSGILTAQDQDELKRFNEMMVAWARRKGSDGKPFFNLPTSTCSTDEEAQSLDQISMSNWLDQQGFQSKVLAWLVDYSCRDDYGLTADQTSAWAGLFYFAARMQSDSGETQDVLTWPEGNGFLVDQLRERMGDRVRLNQATMEVSKLDDGSFQVSAFDTSTQTRSFLHADQVVMAVPQFVANQVLAEDLCLAASPEARQAFQYGSWWVANVHLTNRPAENSFPMAWDNVPMDSSSLGYVNSVHQTGSDYGATVLTWYSAISSDMPQVVREQMLRLTWAEAAEAVITDLEIMHPDIRGLISRLDVMLWGHAMVQPRVGTIFHPARQAVAQSRGGVHFACTDLSGIALFEEAFDHGRRAAMSVAAFDGGA